MIEYFNIAGYCRISVDEELDRDNTSIENQKAIVTDYVKQRFPQNTLTFFEDRDRSGYTFEQREGYQLMRSALVNHQIDILIVKDFSRFSRRNSRGLVELEDLRDAGVRIISIGDGIDFPNDDDWLKIQFQFLINEMPVTDTSKKVRSVVKRRQADGRWICAAPYGYIIDKAQCFAAVPEEATIINQIFELYNQGWGYRKIANHLTQLRIPTPRMAEKNRKEAAGETCNRNAKAAWSIVTVQGILDNDFYIGTLRQGKFTRKKINGSDLKRSPDEHVVFENHHTPIVDYRIFATAQELRKKRTTSNYRGVKINDNTYSGYLFCGDCGAPMFAMSRADLRSAYRCGAYHRRGLSACTSHHIRVDMLDEVMRGYIRKVKENAADMMARLNADIKNEAADISQNEQSAENLERVLTGLHDELKATKRQRIRDMMKHPEREALLEETYDEMESDLMQRIAGLQNQTSLFADRRNTIIRVNRIAKTAIDIFDDILNKVTLESADLKLIIEKICVYEDHIEVLLKADIDAIIKSGLPQELRTSESDTKTPVTVGTTENFNQGIMDSLKTQIVQSSFKRKDKVYDVNVISDGDPLEIYTDNDGEVIFKKYSPIGELGTFATQYAEVLQKSGGYPVVVCDRDHVIAVAGLPKKELLERRVSPALEELMESRRVHAVSGGESRDFQPVEGIDRFALVAAPIVTSGDVCGAIMFMLGDDGGTAAEAEIKLINVAAGFLGKQMEE
ncbi:MAG: stage V sporulation T C-terminal domain-containing protein [Candidatus Fimivivens sp.]